MKIDVFDSTTSGVLPSRCERVQGKVSPGATIGVVGIIGNSPQSFILAQRGDTTLAIGSSRVAALVGHRR